MKQLSRGIGKITDALEIIAALALSIMILHIVLDVALKYLFNTPIPDVSSYVAHYYMVSCVFLPLAFVERERQAISVDVLYDRLSRSAKRRLAILATLATLVFFGLLGFQSLFDAMDSYAKGEFVDGATTVPIWQGRILIPVGFAVALLVLLQRLVGESRGEIGDDHERGAAL